MNDETLERIRMCIAEAGYDPSLVRATPNGGVAVPLSVPRFVAWRAGALAGAGLCCWPCRRAMGWIPPPAPRPKCEHPIDPFCAEDAEAAA